MTRTTRKERGFTAPWCAVAHPWLDAASAAQPGQWAAPWIGRRARRAVEDHLREQRSERQRFDLHATELALRHLSR